MTTTFPDRLSDFRLTIPPHPALHVVSLEQTQALVIRLADFSESSKVATLFTRDFGKVAVIAKGAKRLKSAFEAALDLLTVCQIVFVRKSTDALDILTEAKLISRFRITSKELPRLYAGYYVAELLEALTEPDDPHPALFEAALRTLDRLQDTLAWPMIVTHFEFVLLREIGHLPDFETCQGCGGPALPERGPFAFRTTGVLCAACAAEHPEGLRIQGGTLAVIHQLLRDTGTAWERVVLRPDQVRELRSVTVQTISALLGRRPKTLAFLK